MSSAGGVVVDDTVFDARGRLHLFFFFCYRAAVAQQLHHAQKHTQQNCEVANAAQTL